MLQNNAPKFFSRALIPREIFPGADSPLTSPPYSPHTVDMRAGDRTTNPPGYIVRVARGWTYIATDTGRYIAQRTKEGP